MHYIGAAILNQVISKPVNIATMMSNNFVALFPLGSAAYGVATTKAKQKL